MTDQWRTVRLPEDLCAAAEQLHRSNFATLEDLLVFVLRDLTQTDSDRMDKQEQVIVEQRLRDLGYL
jgi:hypothetical protein